MRGYERVVVFTLGRFWRVKGPGLVILIPGVQQVVRALPGDRARVQAHCDDPGDRRRWIFEKNGGRRTVDVKARLLVSDDFAWRAAAACAGAGVMRPADFGLLPYLSADLLVPVLTEWEALEAPTVFAAHPRHQRQSRLVRVFIDFLLQIFAELDSERASMVRSAIPRVPKPARFGRAQGRQSAFDARVRNRGA